MQAGRQASNQAGRQACMNAGRHAGMHAGRQACRQAGKQAGRQAGMQAGKARQCQAMLAKLSKVNIMQTIQEQYSAMQSRAKQGMCQGISTRVELSPPWHGKLQADLHIVLQIPWLTPMFVKKWVAHSCCRQHAGYILCVVKLVCI